MLYDLLNFLFEYIGLEAHNAVICSIHVTYSSGLIPTIHNVLIERKNHCSAT
jgi:hypothetical protein